MEALEAYQKGFNEGYAKAKLLFQKQINESEDKVTIEERVLHILEENIVNGTELIHFLGIRMSHKKMRYRYNTELWSEPFWEIIDLAPISQENILINELKKKGFEPVYLSRHELKIVPTYELAKRFKKDGIEFYKLLQEKKLLDDNYELTELGSLYAELIDGKQRNIKLQNQGINFSYRWKRKVLEVLC